jgi:glycosyltransferase involved in cell wall biosynthesis
MIEGLVSTIIPVYNRPTLILDAVESVLQQTYRPIEIIIVDDGSSDTTLTVAKQLASVNSEITILSIANSGPGIAREHGRKIAKGEFIQYLDSDDLLDPRKFELQVQKLVNKPDCGVSYCIQQLSNMQGQILDPQWMRTGICFETMFPAMLGGRIWGTPVPLYRARLLNQAGPWLNVTNQEDWEYDCRIASTSVKLDYSSEVLVTGRIHDQTHFGKITRHDTKKLIDKALVYEAIYRHALAANIELSNLEFKKFNRMVFFLARRCAERNLNKDAKRLMQLAKFSAHGFRRKLEYMLYTTLSYALGWNRVGKISAKFDKHRS